MMTFIISILIIWNLYNTILIHSNTKGDLGQDVLDKMTVRILQIHCKRLDDLEKTVYKKEE